MDSPLFHHRYSTVQAFISLAFSIAVDLEFVNSSVTQTYLWPRKYPFKKSKYDDICASVNPSLILKIPM
jgi:hypothetical protein